MINKKLSLVPHSPGCYLMKDNKGYIIYVGKSKNLKNRLSSYFKSSHVGKTRVLVENITDFEYILTNTELESSLLEINLIKKYNPKYNVLLRDDKTYPYIELTNDKIPRLVIVRNPRILKNKERKLFGPYPNVTAARKTTEIINRLYPLRKCNTMPKKECLYYHLGQCLGYCKYTIDQQKVDKMRKEIISFLGGNHEIITTKLEEKMEYFAEKLEYEKAREYKELLDYIKITLEKQKVELDDNIDRDIINYYSDGIYLSINILFIRGGKLLDCRNVMFPIIDISESELDKYIISFYQKHQVYPKEIILPNTCNINLIDKIIPAKFINPQKGTKKKLLTLAYDNAKNYYNEQINILKKDEEKNAKNLKQLKELLDVSSVRRIELFDNSNLFGTFNVSGMVVFIDGKPAKNEYRKYKITIDKNDDYATMREVIYRRYFRVLKDNLEVPDLIIVDGGAGQINIAKDVISSLGLNIYVCGLKKDSNHNTACLLKENLEEVPLKKSDELFLFLTRMQDEVHNYTINYHRTIRSKSSISSILDEIKGIGQERKKQLLKKYKTISAIKNCSAFELSSIIPYTVAESLLEYINNRE